MARRGKVIIDREICKGCLLCVRACPVTVLEQDVRPNTSGSYPSVPARLEKCIACANCFEVCPDICIEVYEIYESDEAAG
jgi:2-oxoglutarate ferredoxin oxidoreductase subunit delta